MFLSIPFYFSSFSVGGRTTSLMTPSFFAQKINTPSARRITATPRNGFSLTTRSAAAEKKLSART